MARRRPTTARLFLQPPPEECPFPVRGYVLINCFFYLFLMLVYWSARMALKSETVGLIPILMAIGLCFTLVSVYDGLVDRVIQKRRRAHEISQKQETSGDGSQTSSTGSSPSASAKAPTGGATGTSS